MTSESNPSPLTPSEEGNLCFLLNLLIFVFSLSASQSPRIEYSSSFSGRSSDWIGTRRSFHLERRALSSKIRENLEGRFE